MRPRRRTTCAAPTSLSSFRAAATSRRFRFLLGTPVQRQPLDTIAEVMTFSDVQSSFSRFLLSRWRLEACRRLRTMKFLKRELEPRRKPVRIAGCQGYVQIDTDRRFSWRNLLASNRPPPLDQFRPSLAAILRISLGAASWAQEAETTGPRSSSVGTCEPRAAHSSLASRPPHDRSVSAALPACRAWHALGARTSTVEAHARRPRRLPG